MQVLMALRAPWDPGSCACCVHSAIMVTGMTRAGVSVDRLPGITLGSLRLQRVATAIEASPDVVIDQLADVPPLEEA